MYGESKYGVFSYGSKTEEKQEEYYENLIKLVPGIVSDLREMKALYISQGYQVGKLIHDLSDMTMQCFLITATWGLGRWEALFGVETDLSLTYEQRREILIAKICGQGTTTKKMIEGTAAAFSGGEVLVEEDNKNYRFIIKFIGIKGIPRNMQGFINMLEEIKPAHMAYEFQYRYTVWEELDVYSWSALASGTWDGVKILKEDRT